MVAISNHTMIALAWLTALNQKDFTQISALSADTFTSIVRPTSIGITPTNKTTFIANSKVSPIKDYNLTLPATADIIESTDALAFYTTTNGQTTHGFPWKNEYQWTFRFTGDLIQSTAEFADATLVAAVLAKEAAVAEAKFTCP